MKKTIKKVLAAVLAATMIIGSMAVAAFAADTYNVAGAPELCGDNWDPAKNQMTANGDGTYSCTFTGIKEGTYEFKVATNGAWNNGEYNLEGDASSGGSNAKVTVDKDNSTVVISFDGTKASVVVNPATDKKAGDASHTALFVVLAVAATAAVVTVAAKKRTVTE